MLDERNLAEGEVAPLRVGKRRRRSGRDDKRREGREYGVSFNGTTQQIFCDYNGHGSVRGLRKPRRKRRRRSGRDDQRQEGREYSVSFNGTTQQISYDYNGHVPVQGRRKLTGAD